MQYVIFDSDVSFQGVWFESAGAMRQTKYAISLA